MSDAPQHAEPSHPTVLVWRWTVLEGAETFIRNQLESYRRWSPVLVGADRAVSSNSRDEDRTLFGAGSRARVVRQYFRVTDRSMQLTRLAQAIRPDIVHAHFAIDGMRMRRVAAQLNVPLVVTLHGADITSSPQRRGLRGMRYRRRLRGLFRDADLLLAVSHHIAAEAEKLGAPKEKLTVLPIGVPMLGGGRGEADSAEPRQEAAQGPGCSDILFVGRMVEKKGVGDLIEAFSGLSAEQRGGARLSIVGDGPMREQLERQAAASDAAIDFHGFLSPGQVAQWMARSLAVAVPSKTGSNGDTEGLPTVVFEAARAGTPVIAYAHAGIPEAVTHEVTGLLAPEGDVDGLRENLLRVISDRQLGARLGGASHARFERDFDIQRQTGRLEELYDQLLTAGA